MKVRKESEDLYTRVLERQCLTLRQMNSGIFSTRVFLQWNLSLNHASLFKPCNQCESWIFFPSFWRIIYNNEKSLKQTALINYFKLKFLFWHQIETTIRCFLCLKFLRSDMMCWTRNLRLSAIKWCASATTSWGNWRTTHHQTRECHEGVAASLKPLRNWTTRPSRASHVCMLFIIQEFWHMQYYTPDICWCTWYIVCPCHPYFLKCGNLLIDII